MRDVCSPAARATATGAARVPLVLTTRVHVHVGRCPARPTRLWLPQSPSRRARRPARRSPPARRRAAGCGTRLSAAWPAPAGGAATSGVASVTPCAGRATAPGDQFARLPQGDVHSPVVAAEFGEFAGAVERIDDPHPLGREPTGLSTPSSDSTASPGRRWRAPPSGSRGSACPPQTFARCASRRRAHHARRAAARRPLWPVARRPSSHRSVVTAGSPACSTTMSRQLVCCAVRGQPQVGILRPLIGAVDPGEMCDLARAGLGVQPFGSRRRSPRAACRRTSRRSRCPASVCHLARQLAVLGERADRGHQHDLTGVGHQRRDMRQSAQVLGPVGHGEPEVGVEAVAQVVAVENVCGNPISSSFCSTSIATDDLPEPDKPGEPHRPALAQPVVGGDTAIRWRTVLGLRRARRDVAAGSCRPRRCRWCPGRSG